MKTQLSRLTFDPKKRFSGVFQQMGRMLTDADWNESVDIGRDQLVQALLDLIGSGTPKHEGMVGLDAAGTKLRWGRAYVDGILSQSRPASDAVLTDPELFEYGAQADLPEAPPLPTTDPYRLYLDVWERTVCALEDPELQDPGLHGADTCTRTQTMAQVKWCPTSIDPQDPAQNPAIGDARATFVLRQGTTTPDPCDPCADELSLHDTVGNYLFRLEVHDVVYDSTGAPSRITLKWSRENGAEAFVAGSEPPGFALADRVYEFFSGPAATERLASEKHLGFHVATGFAPVRGILEAGYPTVLPASRSHVRRWDGYGTFELNSGAWTLVEGVDCGVTLSTSNAANAPGHVTEGTDLELQLDRMVVTFALGSGRALAGDFWTAAVRQAVHSPGDVLLDAAAPAGILHHYMTLGTVTNGVFEAENGDRCKPFEFPSLTDLHATDICYENSACSMPNVHTVQEAIDHLCKARDLKWHNKHLHGWGIVCGLIAQCACPPGSSEANDASGRSLCVTKGYAIDCEGNDLVLSQNRQLDMLSLIDVHDQSSSSPILSNGSGTACLSIGLGSSGDVTFAVEPYDASAHGFASVLNGTLLQDFLQHCVLDLFKALGVELSFLDPDTAEAEEARTGVLVSEQRKRLTSLLNLLVQLINVQNGRYVFLSHKEHEILRDLYLKLRELLKSKTFCGMFAGHDFPAYPFPDRRATTFFGKNSHRRIKLHPEGKLVYSYAGTDNTLNVYAAESGEMVSVTEVPGPSGARITALEFSQDAKHVFVISSVGDADSILSRGRILGAGAHDWDATTVLCDLTITELRRSPREPGVLFAIGKAKGLFVLRPDLIIDAGKVKPKATYAFNAYGHLIVDSDARFAYATSVAQAGAATRYNQVVVLDLGVTVGDDEEAVEEAAPTFSFTVPPGSDGIELGPQQDGRALLYVIVDPAPSTADKQLVTYVMDGGGAANVSAQLLIEETQWAMAYHKTLDRLILSAEDSYRLQVVEPSGARAVEFRVPVQLQPVDVVVEPNEGTIYALNFLSNTLSQIPRTELELPDSYLDELAKYRSEILEAFYALLGGLLQYLKDCFCHHLLVKCPSCKGDEKIYLGVVEIREGVVYRICNFDKRKYVKTFPHVQYWLSAIPVLPVVSWLVGKFCCAILPDLFASRKDTYIPPPTIGAGQTISSNTNVVSAKTARESTVYAKGINLAREYRQQRDLVGVYGRFATDAAGARLTNPVASSGVTKQALIGSKVKNAEAELRQRDIQVHKVVKYDSAGAAGHSATFFGTPERIPAGSRVTLYERNGSVVYYGLAPDEVAEGRIDTEANERARSELAEIVAMRDAASREVATLGVQLQEFKVKRETEAAELVALDQRRTSLSQQLETLGATMKQLADTHKRMREEIVKRAPVGEVPGVSANVEKILHQAGIATVADLARAPSATLVRAGIEASAAKRILAAAKRHLKGSAT